MRGWGQTVIWDLAAPTLWRLQQQLGERAVGRGARERLHPQPAARVLRPRADPRDVRRSRGAELGHAGRPAVRRARVGGAGRRGGLPPPVQPARGARVGRARRGRATGCSGSSGRCSRRATSGPTASPGGNALVDVPAGYRARAALRPRASHAGATTRSPASWRTRRATGSPPRSSTRSPRGSRPPRRGARARRPRAFPAPREVARMRPRKPGRNDLCVCGSMRKWKQCCGAVLAE